MDFELRQAREKLEREQRERVQRAKAKTERERRAKAEAARRRDALEASHRERRLDAARAQEEVRTAFPHAPSFELTAPSVNLLSVKSRAENFRNQLMIWDEFRKGDFFFWRLVVSPG
jgi:hypothetical protein